MLTSRLFQVYRRFSTTFNRTFVLSPAVKEALEHQRPVVALESTIISHGMPYPQNLECARSLEKIIKDS
jgi:pseudouridine-5'-phosphate glycosidase